jgi:hypothetical protein
MLMSFLIFLRDRVMPFFLLLTIVIGGIGGIGWLLANTYFWNTSDVRVEVDSEIIGAKITINARILYKDFNFFQGVYPLHITFPMSRDMSCVKECIFTDIPAGDAEIIFYTDSGVQQYEKILILPDTTGSIDRRLLIRTRKITLPNTFNQDVGDTDRASVFFQNTSQNISLFYDKGILFLYDA